jgi:hypothetical protein
LSFRSSDKTAGEIKSGPQVASRKGLFQERIYEIILVDDNNIDSTADVIR